MKTVYRGRDRFRCDGCGKLIAKGETVVHHAVVGKDVHTHSSVVCERRMLVKKGVQLDLFGNWYLMDSPVCNTGVKNQ